MSRQVRLYCWLALITSVCSVAFGMYERDVAFKESHQSGLLFFQNTDLQNRVNRLEQELNDVQRQSIECKSKR